MGIFWPSNIYIYIYIYIFFFFFGGGGGGWSVDAGVVFGAKETNLQILDLWTLVSLIGM